MHTWRQVCRDVPRYVPIAAGYCRTGGGGEGAFMASVTTRFLHDAAGRIKEVPDDCLNEQMRLLTGWVYVHLSGPEMGL